MKLTIGILFTDKDYGYLKELINRIKLCIKNIDYEIIFFDNRNNFKNKLTFLKNYKVLNTGFGNKYQFEARKQIINQADGDYIWFVDADDDVVPLDFDLNELLELNYDIYGFSFKETLEDDTEKKTILDNELILKNCINKNSINMMTSLWCRIIKKDIFKKAVNKLNDSYSISFGEDLLFVFLTLQIAKSFYKSEHIIYNYNHKTATACVKDFSKKSEDDLYRFLQGIDSFTKICHKYIPMKKIKSLGFSIENATCSNILEKAICTKNIEYQKIMFNAIENNISEKVINEEISYIDKYNFHDLDLTDIQNFFKNILKKNTPVKNDEINNVCNTDGEVVKVTDEDGTTVIVNTNEDIQIIMDSIPQKKNLSSPKSVKMINLVTIINDDNYEYLDDFISKMNNDLYHYYLLDCRETNKKIISKSKSYTVIKLKFTSFFNTLYKGVQNIHNNVDYIQYNDLKNNYNIDSSYTVKNVDIIKFGYVAGRVQDEEVYNSDTFKKLCTNGIYSTIINKKLFIKVCSELSKLKVNLDYYSEALFNLLLIKYAKSIDFVQTDNNVETCYGLSNNILLWDESIKTKNKVLPIINIETFDTNLNKDILNSICYSYTNILFSKINKDIYDSALQVYINLFPRIELLELLEIISNDTTKNFDYVNILQNLVTTNETLISDRTPYKIELADKNWFTIQLNVGLFCNYMCSYCTQDKSNNDTKNFLNILKKWDVIESYVKKQKGSDKKIVYKLIGGETSLYPMTDIINEIWNRTTDDSLRPSRIDIITNGTNMKEIKNLHMWCQEHNLPMGINLSYHEEFTKINEFSNIFNELKNLDNIYLSPFFVIHKGNFNRVLGDSYLFYLETGFYMIPLIRFYKENLKIIKNENFNERETSLLKKYYNNIPDLFHSYIYCTLKNGEVILGGSISEIELKLGFNISTLKAICNVGSSYLILDSKGKVYTDENTYNIIGNIKNKNIVNKKKPTICNQLICNCNIGYLVSLN